MKATQVCPGRKVLALQRIIEALDDHVDQRSQSILLEHPRHVRMTGEQARCRLIAFAQLRE